MRLFDVSRPTIDRWCRDNPDFPRKLKLGLPGNDYYSTRFVVSEVNHYVASLEHRAEISDASAQMRGTANTRANMSQGSKGILCHGR